jgi:hypothetical protein
MAAFFVLSSTGMSTCLEPALDEPTDGLRAARLVLLLSCPMVDLVHELVR